MRTLIFCPTLLRVGFCGLLSACSPDQTVPDPGTVSYERVQGIFDKRCAGGACHVDTVSPRITGANLDLSALQAAPCLLNIPSMQDPQRVRVKPGDPAASYLMCKIDRTCNAILGTWMPIADQLSAEDVAVLRAWIEQGAKGGATGSCGSSPAGTADTMAPSFAGATSATSVPQSVLVQWTAGSDNVTLQNQLIYLIYQATTSGAENFATPSYTSAAGATSFSAGKLSINTKYFFVVRAKDQAGNIDGNKVEVSATTPATVDMQAPTFSGLSSASASGAATINLSWSTASDNITAAAQITYLVYQSSTAGGENFGTPSYMTVPGATSISITGLNPGAKYFFVVRAQDGAGNTDVNSVEKSTTTASISFSGQVQPIFNANCTGGACHSGKMPAQGLDLSSVSVAFANLVNVASSQCPSTQRVLPMQPDSSYLVWKLQGSGPCYSGSRMPKGTPLSSADIATIRNWIVAGAPNN